MQREGPPSLFLCRSFPQALTADAEWGMIEKIRRASFFDTAGVRRGRCPARCLSVAGAGNEGGGAQGARKNMIKDILFDLDGTLTEPFEGITNSVLYALQKCGIAETDREKPRAFIGPPLLASFSEYYDMTREEARLAVSFYREYYEERGIFENAVIPGIPALVQALSERYRLFVATSKPELFAERIMERFGLRPYFVRTFGASLDETRTEKAEVIAYALREGGIARETALMVGDRKHDILGAKANGIRSMGVLFGYGSREELAEAGADCIAETPADVSDMVEKMGGCPCECGRRRR